MIRPALFTATLLLLFGFDNPQGLPWRAASAPDPTVLNGFTLPVMPRFAPSLALAVILARIGSVNAAVFPVPVCAIPMRSCPARSR